jgi:hypothetical protein
LLSSRYGGKKRERLRRERQMTKRAQILTNKKIG